jgi:hypothetical protein
MFDGKFLCTLTALIIAVFAICNFNTKKETGLVENFGFGLQSGPSKISSFNHQGVSHPLANPSAKLMMPGTASSMNQAVSTLTGGVASVAPTQENFGFTVPANTQKMLSPRGSAGSFGVGPNIRYNTPSSDHMAFPTSEEYGNMVQENYSVGETNCGVSGTPYQASPEPPVENYASGNYNELIAGLPSKDSSTINAQLNNSLPIPDMSVQDSEDTEVVNYQRLTFANVESRLRSQGDKIRGDLPIAPCKQSWFNPSAASNPLGHLEQGAMNVMAGFNPHNELQASMTRLASATQGAQNGGVVVGGSLLDTDELVSVNALTDVSVSLHP